MATQAIDGAALRQLVNLARKQSVSFAFSPGGKTGDVLLMDKRQPAASLAKDAKKISASAKAAFGRMTAEGGTVLLECDTALPNLAQSLRKYMKDNGVSTDVQMASRAEPEPQAPGPPSPTETEVATEPGPDADRATQRELSNELKSAVLTAASVSAEAQRLAAAAAKQIALQIQDNELEAAAKSLAALVQRIRGMKATPDGQPAPKETRSDLAAARRDWAMARKSAVGDVRALVAGVAQATGDSKGFAHAPREIAKLAQPIQQLDARLDTLLAQIEVAGPGPEHQKLTQAAQRQISDHAGLMNTDFFKAVDQSGFAKTSIRATVLGSLRKVNKAIGA